MARKWFQNRIVTRICRMGAHATQRSPETASKQVPVAASRRLPTPRQVLAFFKNAFVRAYSLAILVLLCWAGWLAATYLRHSVFLPTQVPVKLLQWQGRVDVAALRQQNVPGVTGTAGRAPLGHYHGVDRWFQEDLTNTCTTIGCHEPLPHGQKMKVPAFANFHTTFLDCRMCHTDVHNAVGQKAAGQKARVIWISATTGQAQDLPAIMALLRFLDTQRDLIGQNPEAAHRTIAGLLQDTLNGVGQDPALEGLLAQLQTSAPGGPVWRQAVDELGHELPLHVRGEYAAKLAPLGARDPLTDAAKTTATQTAAYLAAPVGDRRAGFKDAIHTPLLKEAVSCVACHDEKDSMLDFEALGYSTQRATALRTLPLARMMQRIRQGERFYIPQILEGE